MPYEILMPQLGLTMTEGAVTTWMKTVGEKVEKGEIIFTVQTDKVEMEVESFGKGYVERILVAPDQVVPVGTLIATLSDSPPGSAVPALEVPGPAPRDRDTPPVSPRARRVAQELNIDIAAVKPANGKRVTEQDVLLFHQSETSAPSTPQPVEQLSRARKITAQRMTSSFQTAPHFYLGVEANANEIVRLRDAILPTTTARFGVKLTYTDFFLKALATALFEQPAVNAHWAEQGIVRNESVDIGFAVQTDAGLVVPVLRNAAQLPLLELARQRALLTSKAREGRLALAEMQGGSATLSNLGNTAIDWFQAILNPPQSVILAVGRIAKRAVVVNDQVQALPTVVLNLSADHRVLDGVAGANFLSRVSELLENPALLLL